MLAVATSPALVRHAPLAPITELPPPAVDGDAVERERDWQDFLAGAAGGKPTAARYLGIEVRALDDWMLPVGKPRGRGVPFSKLGKAVRFQRASLDLWLLAQEQNAPARPDAAKPFHTLA